MAGGLSVAVFDASALIAHCSSADAHHTEAVAEMLAAARHRTLVHPVTMAECLVGPARRGAGAARQREIVGLGFELVTLDEQAPLRLAALRASTALELPDCYVIDAAVEHGARLVSFDATLRAAATSFGLTVNPMPGAPVR